MEAVVLFIGWLVPIVLIVFLFRTLHTIVPGIRSLNAAAQRTADALERIEARGGGL